MYENFSRRSGGEGDGPAGCAASKINRVWCTALPGLQEDLARVCSAAPVHLGWTENQKTSFNQCSLSITQFGFFGLALVYPERFGIHDCSRQDMEDFVHVWRTIGYYMGVRDEFNFGRGTLEEVEERSRWLIRALVVPKFRDVDAKWEHMSRCVAEGLRMYVRRAMPFETSFQYLCDVLGLDLVNFRKGLGLRQRLKLWWTGFLMKFVLKYDCVKSTMNRAVLKRLSRATREFNDERVQSKLKETVFEYDNGTPNA